MEMSYVTHLQNFYTRYLLYIQGTTNINTKQLYIRTQTSLSSYRQLKTEHLTMRLTTAQQELPWSHVAFQTKGVLYQLLCK